MNNGEREANLLDFDEQGKTGCGFEDPNAAQSIANAQKIVEKQGF